MANPSGEQQEAGHASSSLEGSNPTTNGNSGQDGSGQDGSGRMKHNPGISKEWSFEEQLVLENGLKKFASDSPMIRYAKIALQLPDKTVREVALRSRWMTKKENSKRRKEEHNLTKKNKDKKERVTDSSAKSSQVAARPNTPPYGMPIISMDNDDGISYKAIGGATGDLLEQNVNALNQISANISSFQIQENINLFYQIRDNVFKIMNDLNDMPDVMKQMPPLPVKLNEELAKTILPPTTPPMQNGFS